jgi:hypothetical protein
MSDVDNNQVGGSGEMIKVLSVSDEVVPTIYHASARKRFHDVNLVLGCGDLPPSYLDYIISNLDVPCFYVPGNHDGEPEHTDYGKTLMGPPGGVNIDGRVIRHDGLVLAGLGGSIWYNGASICAATAYSVASADQRLWIGYFNHALATGWHSRRNRRACRLQSPALADRTLSAALPYSRSCPSQLSDE